MTGREVRRSRGNMEGGEEEGGEKEGRREEEKRGVCRKDVVIKPHPFPLLYHAPLVVGVHILVHRIMSFVECYPFSWRQMFHCMCSSVFAFPREFRI